MIYYVNMVICICCCKVSIFFFFKQKTAYEMRISDWSSDVCSSDLWRTRMRRQMVDSDTHAVSRAVDSLLNYETVKYFNAEARETDRYEIGRASCRERVCQYV